MRTSFTGKFTTVNNTDLFLYVNSKLVYVERHIKKQITQLYLDVVTQRCNLERETIKNSLAIAVELSDQFAYNLSVCLLNSKLSTAMSVIISSKYLRTMKPPS